MQYCFASSNTTSRNLPYAILFICIALLLPKASAQEDVAITQSPNPISTKNTPENLSEAQLLSQAETLKRENPPESLNLARKALNLSKNSKNRQVEADALMLLTELSVRLQDIGQSKDYFLKALKIYQETGRKGSEVRDSIAYARLLFDIKAYKEGFAITEKVLPLALDYGNNEFISRIFVANGDAYSDKKSYTDSINSYAKALEYLTADDKNIQRIRGSTYHRIAQAYKKLKDYEQASAFHKRALNQFKSVKDDRWMARAYKNVAKVEHKKNEHIVALEYLLKSIEIHDRLDEPKELSQLLMLAGILFRELNRYEEALDYTNRAYVIASELEDTPRIAELSNQTGHLYERLNKPEQARYFYQLTIDLPENTIADKTIASASREIAVIDYENGQYDIALQMALKAHAIYKKMNDKEKASSSARITAKIYEAQNKDSQAFTYYRESLAHATEVGKKKLKVKSLNALGRYLVEKDPDEAVILLKKSLNLAGKSYRQADKLSTFNALRKAEKNRGNFLKAVEFAEKQIALSEKINTKRESRNIAKTKAKLDSYRLEIEMESLKRKAKLDELEIAHKDAEIQLVEQTNKISKLELVKNRYARILLGILLFICVFVAIYIYRIFSVSNKKNKELSYLADRDPLTNCYNRRVLLNRMNDDFENIEKFDGYSIILADIDHFKQVNDTHGHNTGDSLLRDFAKILKHSVRQEDIIVRYGGEEFCIVLPNTGRRQAMRIAEAIRKKIHSKKFNGLSVTCSFGVSSIKFEAETPTELINQADQALYASKSKGRNQVTLWDPSLD